MGAIRTILSILCLGGLLWPLHLMAINVLYARALNRTVFRIDVAKKAAAALLLFAGVNFGVTGVAGPPLPSGCRRHRQRPSRVHHPRPCAFIEQLRSRHAITSPCLRRGVVVAV